MRSFELNPDVKEPESCVSHYAKAYNAAPEKVAANLRKIGQTAAEDGLTFHYDRAICANTFNAHRLAKYAEANGRPEIVSSKPISGTASMSATETSSKAWPVRKDSTQRSLIRTFILRKCRKTSWTPGEWGFTRFPTS